DQALAAVGNHLYVVTVPQVSGDPVTISVANADNAAFPARKLTDIGGQFPSCSGTGRSVLWGIGNAIARYDLDSARAREIALRDTAAWKDDTTRKPKAYTPDERRVTVRIARDLPQGALVLRGGRAVTMRGTEVIENADIVIVNNRIRAVGARGSVEIPAGATIRDISGRTVIPGFVDTHAHMWPLWGVHTAQPWMYLANLAFGVTTTRDPQTATTDVLTYGDMVESGL